MHQFFKFQRMTNTTSSNLSALMEKLRAAKDKGSLVHDAASGGPGSLALRTPLRAINTAIVPVCLPARMRAAQSWQLGSARKTDAVKSVRRPELSERERKMRELGGASPERWAQYLEQQWAGRPSSDLQHVYARAMADLDAVAHAKSEMFAQISLEYARVMLCVDGLLSCQSRAAAPLPRICTRR